MQDATIAHLFAWRFQLLIWQAFLCRYYRGLAIGSGQGVRLKNHLTGPCIADASVFFQPCRNGANASEHLMVQTEDRTRHLTQAGWRLDPCPCMPISRCECSSGFACQHSVQETSATPVIVANSLGRLRLLLLATGAVLPVSACPLLPVPLCSEKPHIQTYPSMYFAPPPVHKLPVFDPATGEVAGCDLNRRRLLVAPTTPPPLRRFDL